MAIVALLFAVAILIMLAIFPELKQQPHDAAVAGAVMTLAFGLSLLEAWDIWKLSIDHMLAVAFATVAHFLR